MNWKNTGMEKRGQIKVKPHENEKNKNLIMPVMQLVLFFMHISLKRTSKWILKFLRFIFERDTKGKKILQFCFAPLLLTKCMNRSSIAKDP